MFNLIKKSTDFSNFIVTEKHALSKRLIIDELEKETITGAIIKGFFNKELTRKFLTIYNTKDRESFVSFPDNQGTIFPNPFYYFSNVSVNNIEEKSKVEVEKLNQVLNSINPLFESELFNFFNSITSKKVKKFNTPNGVSFLWASFRELFGQRNGINFHYDLVILQEFKRLFSEFFRFENNFQLSYFILLQKPEKGGDLQLINYREKTLERNHETNQIFVSGDMRELDFSKEDIFSPKLEEGDLILFNGGSWWHQVSPIKGNTSRITLGGFLTQTNDGYKVWT